mgnify:CR=1 FL=1
MLQNSLIIIGAYFWGGIPSAYIIGKLIKRIDIREYGSGNVGASNITINFNIWMGLSVGTFDTIVKSTIPIVLANLFDQSLWIQMSIGIATIAGHNWSPYLKFTGGRGISTTIGVMLGLVMWKEIISGIILLGIIGHMILKQTALFTLITAISLPFITYFANGNVELTYISVSFTTLIILKRLTSNWSSPPSNQLLVKTLILRFLWDRDLREKDIWTSRKP